MDYLQVKPFLTPDDKVFSGSSRASCRAASYYNHVVVRDKKHPLHSEVVGKSMSRAAKSSPRFLGETKNHQCFYLSCHRSFSEARSVMEEYRPRVFTMNEAEAS